MPATGRRSRADRLEDLLHLVREVSKRCRIRGFDVVELAPIRDCRPDFLASKLVYRIMGYVTNG